jgi:CBS domain-containing protein
MAAKRTDAVLVVDQEGVLVGILTDKDIAYRVVAEGLDARSTTISSVMTKNPIHLLATGHRNDALTIMLEKKFRHLPVLSKANCEDGSGETCTVVGILDITKCVFDRLDELSLKAHKDDALLQAFGTINENYGAELLGNISSQIQGCPDVGSVLAKISASPDYLVPEVTLRVNVKEAACLMKELHVTAVLVVGSSEGEDVAGKSLIMIIGIFTTKDIILRVLAAQLEPSNTSIVRVMTSHPDFVTPCTSILECLQKLKGIHQQTYFSWALFTFTSCQ